jgi:hypothetical protein
MTDFFASLYEWFGLGPFYNSDLGEHLRGADIVGGPSMGYTGTPLYSIVGFINIAIVVFMYCLFYYIINSSKFNQRGHYFLILAITLGINFFIAFIYSFNDLQSGNYFQGNETDVALSFSTTDCIGFGFSNVIWAFIIFGILTFIKPLRNFSKNCRHTPFKQ